jgi:enoyl-CoA hydratase/carnithine racemase
MTSGEVLVELDDDVLRVTINRPEKRNPLSRPVLAAIGEAFRVHRDRQELRLGLVTAAGTRALLRAATCGKSNRFARSRRPDNSPMKPTPRSMRFVASRCP